MALAANKDNSYSQHYTPEHLDRLKSELESYQQQLVDAQQKLDQLSGAIESYDEFLELYENVADLLRYTTGLSAKDEIIRTFFLNFTVKGEPAPPNYKQKQWSAIDHCLAEPFKTFVENGEFSNGRSKANNFEPYIISLLHALNKMWDSTSYEKETAPIVAALDDFESSNQIKGKIYAY